MNQPSSPPTTKPLSVRGAGIFPIRTKLTLYSLLLGTSTILVVALLAYWQAAQILREERLETFRSLRNSLTQSIVSFFATKRNYIAGQAESGTLTSALKEFSETRANLLSDLANNGFIVDDPFMEIVTAKNNQACRETLLKPVSQVTNVQPEVAEAILPQSRESQILLYVYNASNPAPVGRKNEGNSSAEVASNESLPEAFRLAFSKTSYALAMDKYHPLLSHVCQRFDYNDLLLSDPNGNIVYSYAKHFDYGASAVSAYWQQTDVGRLFLACWYSPLPSGNRLSSEQVLNSDFHRYLADYDNPRLFFSCALADDPKNKLGVAIYQIGDQALTRLTTFENRLEKAGLGKTGEAYISGSDFLARTDSRFLDSLTEGTQKRKSLGSDGQPVGFSAVLQLPLVTKIDQIIYSDSDSLNSGEFSYRDYRGVSSLGLASPLPLPGLNWGLVLKIDTNEAFHPAIQLGASIAIIGGLALLVIGLLSFYGATNFARPITDLARSAQKIAAGDINERAYVTSRDEIGLLAGIFNEMVDKLNSRSEQQMRKILDTVSQGLFLMSPELIIQTPYSASLESILSSQHLEGQNLVDVLSRMIAAKTLETLREYIDILLDKNVKESLIRQLNPLEEVEVNLDRGSGKYTTKHLQFSFGRVLEEGEINHIMVTVNDITQRIQLAQELEKAQSKTTTQFDLIFAIMHVEPGDLRDFIEGAEKQLQHINAVLRVESDPAEKGRDRQKRYQALLNNIYRTIHNFKGNAAVLRVTFFESLAHDFEQSVAELQKHDSLTGNDFLGLTLQLATIIAYVEETKEVIKRFGEMNRSMTDTPAAGNQGLFRVIESFGLDLAAKLKKKVSFEFADDAAEALFVGHRGILRDSLIQFTRNAMVHGLESPEERVAVGKEETGRIQVQLHSVPGSDGLQVLFRDDGAGISRAKVRQQALQLQLLSEEQAESMSEDDWLDVLFWPGFTTAESVTLVAGRGVGLDLVKSQITSVGGTITVHSEEGRYSEFQIVFPG